MGGDGKLNSNMLLGKIKEKRLTQEKVSKAIGISLSALRRKIEGKTEFTREEINKICKLLEVSDEDLLAIFFND